MSRCVNVALVLIAILFSGCVSEKNLHVDIATIDTDINHDKNFMMIEALYNEYNDKNISKSIENYKKLHDDTNSSIYLTSALRLSFDMEDKSDFDNLLKKALKLYPKNLDIKKIHAKRLMQKKRYKDAKKVVKSILKKEKNAQNYMLLGTNYYFQNNFNTALRYFQKAYRINFSENILIKIATLLDEKLHKRKKAIKNLESFIRFNKASIVSYMKLLHLYSKDTDVDGLISTYKLMYKKFNDKRYAKKVVELLMYQNHHKKAISYLEDTGFDQNTLLELYVQNSRFDDAIKLANVLYEQSSNVEYLGRVAIYEYEKHEKNLTPKVIKSISHKFEEVIEKMQTPLFLNYYGYFLIDNDIDIAKGIKLVKMALEREPKSVYYIDSLAWGYYKQKRCIKAQELMEKIISKSTEEDIKTHYKLILKCIKEMK